MMEAIPFINQESPANEVLAGASPVAMNVFVDSRSCLLRRPGITTFAGAPSGLIEDPSYGGTGLGNLYMTTHGVLYAVGTNSAERSIYKITSGGATDLGGSLGHPGGATPPNGLKGSARPVFAETEMLLVIAGGDLLQKIVLSTNASSRLGGNPPKATHVLAQANRLLANDATIDRTAVRFSDAFGGLVSYAGAEVWSYGGFGTSGYFTAQTRPDDVVALGQTTSEVYVFGEQSEQTFQQDPDVTFAPVVTHEVGMSAAYSWIQADGQSFWLDQYRRIVSSSGRGFQDISDDISTELEDLTTVSDCWAFRPLLGQLDAVCWRFPNSGLTYCFQKGAGWGQWASWDSNVGNWKDLIITGHCISPIDATNIVCTSTGKIGSLSFDASTDFGDPIRAYIETGYLNRNTDSYKLCRRVMLTLRRGTTSSSIGPQAKLSFRDRPGEWTDIPVDLGVSGDNEIVYNVYALGTYRRRQWRFSYEGSEALALVSAVEEFDISGG